jgi:DNA modification methylase
MAPEIALAETVALPPGSFVLDPMTGSGTAVRFASEVGHRAIAFDKDPLAALMTKVWTTPICPDRLLESAAAVASQAAALDPASTNLPWIDNDPETDEFVNYWFASRQRDDLRRLSSLLVNHRGPIGDAMMIALSRILITKQRGASLAWDVSHSRPHKKLRKNSFCVIPEFLRSVGFLAKRLREQPPVGNVLVAIADARRLNSVTDNSVDAVLTSPPYLNAIDYLRGHKFSLVWLGHTIHELRAVRSKNVGSERNLVVGSNEALANELARSIPQVNRLPNREQGIFRRYLLDIFAVVSETHRVLKSGGKAVFVVGNSRIRGVFIENALAITAIAARSGLALVAGYERDLPSNRRYLPPPTAPKASHLSRRMRTESVLSFIKG